MMLASRGDSGPPCGVPSSVAVTTPFTITRYHNGEMAGQRYLTKVVYNAPLDPSLFDPAVLLKKK